MRTCFVLVALAVLPACHAAREPALGGAGVPEQPLKLEAVRFYEAGISYFERAGTVSQGEKTALFVPEAHLDDALRTLVVLTGNRTLTAEFETTVPSEMARVGAALPLPSDDGFDRTQILKSFLNVEVEVETPSGTVRGRLTGVGDELTIAGPDGVRGIAKSEVTRVLPTDPEVRARLERVLNRSPELARTRYRALEGLATGGPLRIGYIAETPLWEPTYRLFLSESELKARLVASALVHNDTDEPWSSVRATFASDRPESSLYEFTWPFYLRRSRVERWSGELLPQLGATKSVDVLEEPTSNGQGFSGKISVPRNRERVPASGSFEYRAPKPISVRARGSVLVPFFDGVLPVRAIVWTTWERPVATRAVRIENLTEQTLPGGSLSAVAGDVFVGDTWLPRLLPREHAFVELAEELDVTVEDESTKETNAPEDVTFDEGTIGQRWREKYERTYVIENRKATPVSVYVWLPFETIPSAEGFDRVEDGNTYAPAGVIEVGAKQRVRRNVSVEARATRYSNIDELLPSDLRELAKAPISAEATRGLAALATLSERLAANGAAITQVSHRFEDIDFDLESARSDLSSLGAAGGAAAERIVTRLLALQAERSRASERDRTLQDEAERLRAERQAELERLPKPAAVPGYVRRSVRKK